MGMAGKCLAGSRCFAVVKRGQAILDLPVPLCCRTFLLQCNQYFIMSYNDQVDPQAVINEAKAKIQQELLMNVTNVSANLS